MFESQNMIGLTPVISYREDSRILGNKQEDFSGFCHHLNLLGICDSFSQGKYNEYRCKHNDSSTKRNAIKDAVWRDELAQNTLQLKL
jgi:hypothetical protein